MPFVNVRVEGETVASPVSADVAETTTSDVGCASSTTVKVPVVPASETVAVAPESVTPAGPEPSTVVRKLLETPVPSAVIFAVAAEGSKSAVP